MGRPRRWLFTRRPQLTRLPAAATFLALCPTGLAEPAPAIHYAPAENLEHIDVALIDSSQRDGTIVQSGNGGGAGVRLAKPKGKANPEAGEMESALRRRALELLRLSYRNREGR
jgi:hypothetical protein